MNNTPPESTATSEPRAILSDPEEGDPDPSRSTQIETSINQTSLDERSLIDRFAEIFTAGYPVHLAPSYQDDCARLKMKMRGESLHSELLVTTDALCEGVHFETARDSYRQIGAQAAVVNLSDLASSGARPVALLWSLSLPSALSGEAVSELAQGFADVASRHTCPVIGGNICARPGGLEIHVTAIGAPFKTAISRSGARPGDLIYVTGSLGERALGYLDPTPKTRAQRHQWRPHLTEAKTLAQWGQVSAMLDISDGLLIDAERLAQASDVHVDLHAESLPLSEFVRSHSLGRYAALRGGEDYILLFTAPAQLTPPPEVQATLIGRCLDRDLDAPFLTLDGAPCEGEGHLYHIGR